MWGMGRAGQARSRNLGSGTRAAASTSTSAAPAASRARAQESAVAPEHRSFMTRYFEGPYAHLRRAPDPMAEKTYSLEFGIGLLP